MKSLLRHLLVAGFAVMTAASATLHAAESSPADRDAFWNQVESAEARLLVGAGRVMLDASPSITAPALDLGKLHSPAEAEGAIARLTQAYTAYQKMMRVLKEQGSLKIYFLTAKENREYVELLKLYVIETYHLEQTAAGQFELATSEWGRWHAGPVSDAFPYDGTHGVAFARAYSARACRGNIEEMLYRQKEIDALALRLLPLEQKALSRSREYEEALQLAPDVSAAAAAQNTPFVAPSDGAPIMLPRARQFDLTSRLNGRTYRLFVSTPVTSSPPAALPVLYVLDGNWDFTAAALAATASPGQPDVPPTIVVGIGFPSDDDRAISVRRDFELTPSVARTDAVPGLHGGGDAFLRVIEEEIKPFIATRHVVDPTRQVFYGRGLGGLMVLRQLLRHPETFASYVAVDPTVDWNNREVLADEANFSAQVVRGDIKCRLLLIASATERRPGDRASSGIGKNLAAMTARLQALRPSRSSPKQAVFLQENLPAEPVLTVRRGLTFARGP
jgi:predicted alpha/beta superfamily hydrolase